MSDSRDARSGSAVPAARVAVARAAAEADVVAWNDRMYAAHATPYERGIAAWIQRARVARIWRMAGVKPSDAVLELGCEAGRLLIEAPPCARLVGSDVSGLALADAAALFAARGRKAGFVQLDALEPLPFEAGSFDVVVASEMLEHVAEPHRVLEHVHALAGPETRVLVTVPIEAPKLAIKKWLERVGLFDVLFPGIEAGQSEWHLHAFSPAMLRREIRGLFRIAESHIIWAAHQAARLVKI